MSDRRRRSDQDDRSSQRCFLSLNVYLDGHFCKPTTELVFVANVTIVIPGLHSATLVVVGVWHKSVHNQKHFKASRRSPADRARRSFFPHPGFPRFSPIIIICTRGAHFRHTRHHVLMCVWCFLCVNSMCTIWPIAEIFKANRSIGLIMFAQAGDNEEIEELRL